MKWYELFGIVVFLVGEPFLWIGLGFIDLSPFDVLTQVWLFVATVVAVIAVYFLKLWAETDPSEDN